MKRSPGQLELLFLESGRGVTRTGVYVLSVGICRVGREKKRERRRKKYKKKKATLSFFLELTHVYNERGRI